MPDIPEERVSASLLSQWIHMPSLLGTSLLLGFGLARHPNIKDLAWSQFTRLFSNEFGMGAKKV